MIAGLAVFLTLFFSASGLLLGAATAIRFGQNPTAEPGLWWCWMALVIAAIGGWQTTRLNPGRRPGWVEWLLLLFGLLVIFRIGAWSGYLRGDWIDVLLPNNLGDFSLHAGQTAYLVQQPAFPMPAQILQGAPFAYPFGINWIAAGWVTNGAPMTLALSATLILAGTAAVLAAWCWSWRFGIAALLFNGGVAGFAIINDWMFKNFQDPLEWKSLVLAMLGTQRGFAIGLAAGLLLLSHFRWSLSTTARPRAGLRLPAWTLVCLYGTLPLFHLHTFAAVSLIGLIAILLRWRPVGWPLGRSLIVPGLVAVPFVWWVTGGLTLGRQGGWAAGWWMIENEPFWYALWQNFGFWLVLVLLFLAAAAIPPLRLWFIRQRLWSLRRGDAALILLPGALLIGLATGFYKFQPWPWDNTKFFVWSYLVIGVIACDALLGRSPVYIRLPAILLLFLSGAVTLIGGLQPQTTGFGLVERADLTATGEALSHLDTSERFVTSAAADYQHPVILQGGRVTNGYTGHLWSHGYEYEETVLSTQKILSGDPAWLAHAMEIGATLAFWGPREKAAHPGVQPPWAIPQNLVIESPTFSIYRLQPLNKPADRNFQQLWR